jgi:fibronectin type 3 domain-containing protein
MFRKSAVLILISAAILWLACSRDKSTSADSGSIEGRVTADGAGIPGVNITVSPYVLTGGGAKLNDISETAGSASDGDYHINILAGSYRVYYEVSYLGERLTAARYPVEVESGQNVTLNVELKDPAPSNLLVREDNAAVVVTFESAYGAHLYRIYRSLAGQENYQIVATIDSYYGFGTVTFTDRPPEIQSYIYKATAISENGESGPSNTAQIDFGGLIAPPAGLDVSDRIAWIYLIWSQRANAIYYNIYRSAAQNDWTRIGSTLGLAYTDTPGVYGIYNYRLTSVSQYGTESIPGPTVSVNYDGRLDAPEELTIVDRGSLLYLTWQSLEQAAYYLLYRSTSLDGIYDRIDSTFETHYSDRPGPNGEYFYKVAAIGPNGLESDLSSPMSMIFDGILEPPRSIYAQDRGLSVLVDWDPVNWAGAYLLYRSDDGGATYAQAARIASTTSEYTDTPPMAGTYYYKVAVETIDGALGPLSGASLVHYSASLLAPQGIGAQSMGLYIMVSWNTVTGATGYSIYRATEISGDYIEVEDMIQYSPFHDEPPVAGPYYYRVQAFDNNGHRSPMSFQAYVYFPARPIAPMNLSLIDQGYNVRLNWSVSSYYDSCQVFRADTFDGVYIPQFWVLGTSGYDWPSAAGHFYYKVQITYRGVTSEFSDYAHIYFTGRFSPPSNIYGFDAGSSVQLGWTSVENAASYDVYRGTDPDSMVLNQTVYANAATDTPPSDFFVDEIAKLL